MMAQQARTRIRVLSAPVSIRVCFPTQSVHESLLDEVSRATAVLPREYIQP